MVKTDVFVEALQRAKQQSLSHSLLKAGRLVDALGIARIRARLGAPGLRPAHTRLFPHIDLDGSRSTQIAQRAGISKQAVGVLLDELEQMGFVERVTDPTDRRARLVRFPRKRGRSLLDGMAVLGEVDQAMEAALGKTRSRRLRSDLLLVLDHLEQATQDGP